MNLFTALNRLTLVVCLLVSLSGMADPIPEPYLNPHTYYSQNNEFALSVTPSDRYGFGPASYVFKHGNQELWRKDLAYTFKDAAVGNNGDIAGYSYTKGDLKTPSVLQLWVLDSRASLKYSHSYTRHLGAIDAPHVPFAQGLFLHNFNSRITFFIAGIEPKALGLMVDLPSGKELPASSLAYNYYEIRKLIASEKSAYSLVQLEHYGNGESRLDTEFCLLDENWKSLFCKSYQHDLATMNEDVKSRDAFRFSNPAYFGFAESDKFWLSSLKEKRQDYFYIEKLYFSAPAVRPVGSKPLVIPAVVAPQPAPPSSTKTFTLESERPLPDAILKQRQLASVGVFGIDDADQKAVISQKGKHYYFERYDSLNKSISFRPLAVDLEAWKPKNLMRYSSNKWILFCVNYDQSPKVFLLSDSGDLIKEIVITMPSAIEMAESPKGEFYILAQQLNEKATISQLNIDTGKLLWTNKFDGQSFYAEGFSITGDNGVVVLGRSSEKLVYFSLDGKWIKEIAIEKATGIEYSSPADIKAGANGRVYAFSFATHQMLIFNDDKFIKKMPLLDGNGKVMEHVSHIEPDEKGNLWASNEDGRLRQFSEAGREVLAIPKMNAQPVPKKIDWLFVDKDENLLVFDNEQYLLSKIDKQNKLTSVYQSAPAMQSSRESDGLHIGKTNTGFLVREKGKHYVHLDEAGRPASGYAVGCGNCTAVIPQRNANIYWRSGFDDIDLVALDGKTIRKIEKDKEGNWLEFPQFSQNENDWVAIESGGFSHKTVVLDDQGKIRASFDKDGHTASIQTSGNYIYVVDYDGTLKAYDLTGKLVAVAPSDNEDYCCMLAPVLYASSIHKKLYMAGSKSIKVYQLFD